MAVIDKKLIHFTNLTTFEQRLSAGDIKDTSIVFIQDAKQIWTHGVFYASPITEEEIKQLFGGDNIKLNEYVEIESPIDIKATDTVNEAFGKIEEYLGTLDELNAILVDTGDAAFDPIINDYITSTQLENKLLNKQDKLVSGSNIKTINGESILGEGDITISGGDSSSDIYYLDCGTDLSVTEGTIDLSEWDKLASARIITLRFGSNIFASFIRNTTIMNKFISASFISSFDTGRIDYRIISFSKESNSITWTIDSNTLQMNAYYKNNMSETVYTIKPNLFYVWGEVASLDLSFAEEISNVTNEYTFQFDSGLNTSLALPDSIMWYNNISPVINSYKTYLFSILNNYGCFLEFDTIPINVITVESNGDGIYAWSTYPIKTNIYIHFENGLSLLLVKDLDNWSFDDSSLERDDYNITLSFDSQYNETTFIKDDYYCYSLEQSVLIIR